MAADLVLFERRGNVAVFTLNRPDAMNAINQYDRVSSTRPNARIQTWLYQGGFAADGDAA